MTYSVLMTVYNREPALLEATLEALHFARPPSSEIIVVDDGSTVEYTRFPGERWLSAGSYNADRIGDGYNNPARAFNVALAHATGERVVILSSDTVVPRDLFHRLDAHDLERAAWTPRIVNLPGGQEYCGPSRVFPAPWCLAAMREHCLAIGGWDEAYLAGQSYEDNDFIGRLMLHVGAFVGDWRCTAVHQAHPQPAYTSAAAAATQVNREYTLRKWGGSIPFYRHLCPLNLEADPVGAGTVRYVVRGLKQAVA